MLLPLPCVVPSFTSPISISNMVGCKYDMSGCFDGGSTQIDRTRRVVLLLWQPVTRVRVRKTIRYISRCSVPHIVH